MHVVKSYTLTNQTHLSLSCCDNICSLCFRKNTTTTITKLINTNRTRKPKAIATASYMKLFDIAELEVSSEEMGLGVISIDKVFAITDDIVVLIVKSILNMWLEVGVDVRAGNMPM